MAHSEAAADKVTHFQGAAEAEGQALAAAPGVEPARQGRRVFGDGGASGSDGRPAGLPRHRVHHGLDRRQPHPAGRAGAGAACRLSLLGFPRAADASGRASTRVSDERPGLGDPRSVHRGKRRHRLCAGHAARSCAIRPRPTASIDRCERMLGEPGDGAVLRRDLALRHAQPLGPRPQRHPDRSTCPNGSSRWRTCRRPCRNPSSTPRAPTCASFSG
jgi:hypothetical protein